MPPYVSRKRHSSSPTAPPPKRQATAAKNVAKPSKPTLFDAIDKPSGSKATPEDTKAFLQKLEGSDSSSLSDASSDDFEDIPLAEKQKLEGDNQKTDSEDDEDEGMDWEDAIQSTIPGQTTGAADDEIGDLSISLQDDGGVAADKVMAASAAKKGPSKRARMIRIRTHCLHVQGLMWHNAVRNAWLNDKELQKILLDGLSEGMKREIDRWREDMGWKEREIESSKAGKKGKKSKAKKKEKEKRDGRDWGVDAGRLENGVVNMSRGDPLLRMLKILTAYWRKRFTITAPGLRKRGYMPLRRLGDEMKAWKKDQLNAVEHGERIENVQELRKLAKRCEGSRDVGSQLFTALLRALGLEARMVANLQPAGIGWSKHEDARPKKTGKSKDDPEIVEDSSDAEDEVAKAKATPAKPKKSTPTAKAKQEKSLRTSARAESKAVIKLEDDEEGSLSSAISDVDDDASLIDVTPSTPKKPNKKYDRDLPYPIYWTEVLSPISNTYIPVDPIVLSTIASNQELLTSFEPRGKRADQAKQVICYTIAHATDGTAKDVTVRYLKRHQLPGRTKGNRMPIEKIKVYNKRGKVKKYEEYDWFKSVMSSYERPHIKRTAADDLEESTDLKPYKPATDKPKLETESLQWYKQSAEFVLERHLRREEALLPGSKPVKTFTSGKGDKTVEEPVYRRADVVSCKTAESWHKEGREIRIGEQPLKMVPVRAVTTNRKREIEEAERETGEKLKQGLFSYDQCDWIIPPSIENGVIPRNAFGNMDVYTPSMVPKGAIHIPLRGTARICRKLNIDYAEACTGFEFGGRRAVPVLTGVVVAEENEDMVIDAWEIEEEEKRRKEDIKREQACLQLWRKFVMGMRIVERMKTEYADSAGKDEEVNPFVRRKKEQSQTNGSASAKGSIKKEEDIPDDGSVAGGGFLLSGEEDEGDEPKANGMAADLEMDNAGGFLIEDTDERPTSASHPTTNAGPTPESLQAVHSKPSDRDDDISESSPPPIFDNPNPKKAAKSRTKPTPQSKTKPTPPARRKHVVKPPPSSSEDDEDSTLSDPQTQFEDSRQTPSARTKKTSPRVVVTPRKSSTRGNVGARGGKKAPVRSRYFASAAGHGSEGEEDAEKGEEGVEDDDSDIDDDGNVSEEVIRPRMTTARTRGKGGR